MRKNKRLIATLFSLIILTSLATYRSRVDVYNIFTRLKGPCIVFLGDSITRGGGLWDIQLRTKLLQSINLGLNGADLKKILTYTKSELSVIDNSSVIILMAGTNDLKPSASPSTSKLDETIQLYLELIQLLESSRVIKIMIISTPPQSDLRTNYYIQRLNSKIKSEVLGRKKISYVDLWPQISDGLRIDKNMTFDGMHFTKEAYLIWRNAISSEIRIASCK